MATLSEFSVLLTRLLLPNVRPRIQFGCTVAQYLFECD